MPSVARPFVFRPSCWSWLAALVVAAGCGEAPAADAPGLAGRAGAAAVHAAPRPLIGGTFDVHDRFPAVGMLVDLESDDQPAGVCTATLIAEDVLLTAAHCVPGGGQRVRGWMHGDALGTTLHWVAAENPFPVGLHAAHRVVAGETLPGWSPEVLHALNNATPLYARRPETPSEKVAWDAFRAACGEADKFFDQQAQLRCLSQLPPGLQRALGVADAKRSAHDVALLYLAHGVTDVAPLAVAAQLQRTEPLVAGGVVGSGSVGVAASASGTPDAAAPLQVVGYGFRNLEFGWRWLLSWPLGRRTYAQARLYAVGAHQLQLEEEAPVCWGDSGGPVLQAAADGAWQVVGVTSSMLPTSAKPCSQHSLYMRADTLVPWLQDAMARACAAGWRNRDSCARAGW